MRNFGFNYTFYWIGAGGGSALVPYPYLEEPLYLVIYKVVLSSKPALPGSTHAIGD